MRRHLRWVGLAAATCAACDGLAPAAPGGGAPSALPRFVLGAADVGDRTAPAAQPSAEGPPGAWPPISPSPWTALPSDPAGVLATPPPAAPLGPSPRAGGAGGRGGGSAGQLAGMVVSEGGTGGTTPLAGAQVLTDDGRTAITDAAGRFVFATGPASAGTLLASHPEHAASAVIGLGEGDVVLHLQPRSRTTDAPRAALAVPFDATGRIVGPDGAPRPELVVVLEDARGAFSAPATTDADGRFSLRVFAPDGRVEDGTLLVVAGAAQDAWLGVLRGVRLDAGAPVLDGDAATPAADPVAVVPATHPLEVRVDEAGNTGILDANVFMAVADGASLSLPGSLAGKLVAAVPGVRYELQAEMLDPVAGTRSALRRQALAIDFGAGATRVDVAMLRPPDVTAVPADLATTPLAWTPVAGARSYRAILGGLDGQGFVWEGFSTDPGASLGSLSPLAPGRWGLTVEAWDEAGHSPRAIAGLPAPLRALRRLPRTGDWRVASRQVRFVR